MSFSSKQYLAYEQRLLDTEPVRGTARRYKPLSPRAAKNRLFDNLTPEELERLKAESEQEFKNVKYE